MQIWVETSDPAQIPTLQMLLSRRLPRKLLFSSDCPLIVTSMQKLWQAFYPITPVCTVGRGLLF